MKGRYNNGVTVEHPTAELIGDRGRPKLSLYIRNDPDFLTVGVPAFVKTARKILSSAPMSPLELDVFMGPLENVEDALPSNWPGESIAIFRDEQRFRIVPLVAPVPPRVVVATSFHIKPLLAEETRVARGDLLHVYRGRASLHHMYHGRSKLMGEWSLRDGVPTAIDDHLSKCEGPVVMVSDHSTLKLNTHARRVIFSFEEVNPELAQRTYWKLVRTHEDERLAREIDMILGHSERMVAKTASDLAEQLKRRKLKKLYITLEDMAWGEWDEAIGVVSVHRCQANHRDDDLFDDIAETQIRKGTMVKVVPRKLLPVGVAAVGL